MVDHGGRSTHSGEEVLLFLCNSAKVIDLLGVCIHEPCIGRAFEEAQKSGVGVFGGTGCL